MPQLKLISHKLCPYVQRARIVLAEKGIPHEIQFIDLADRPAWFLEISPLGKVPVLLVDGAPLFESAVIAEYLDEISAGSLHPGNVFERARHRSWIEYASSLLNLIAGYYAAPDAERFALAGNEVAARLARLEPEIAGPWFGGEGFSLVDAAFAPVFRYFEVFRDLDGRDYFASHPRLAAWRDRLAARASVKAAVVPDYHRRLLGFLAAKPSVLGGLARAQEAA